MYGMFAGVFDQDTTDGFPNQIELLNAMRRYFSDIVQWTSSLFASIHANTELSTAAIHKRQLKNVMEFSDLLRLYYGDQLALQFEKAFEDFYQNLTNVVSALKRGNMEAANALIDMLYADMDKIASLLGSVSSIDQTALQTVLYEFVYLMLTEAMLIFAHNYDAAIEVYDREMELALRIADSLAYSILQRGQG
jgi:hypothetical protein